MDARQRMLSALLAAFQDESWPVRDVASTALGHFVEAFPEHCEPLRGELWEAQHVIHLQHSYEPIFASLLLYL